MSENKVTGSEVKYEPPKYVDPNVVVDLSNTAPFAPVNAIPATNESMKASLAVPPRAEDKAPSP